MKCVVLGLLLVASTFSSQTPAAQTETRVVATADVVSQEGNTIHLRGHVEVRRGDAIVTAEQADLPARVELDSAPAEIQFRGDVRMRIDGVAPLSVVPR